MSCFAQYNTYYIENKMYSPPQYATHYWAKLYCATVNYQCTYSELSMHLPVTASYAIVSLNSSTNGVMWNFSWTSQLFHCM